MTRRCVFAIAVAFSVAGCAWSNSLYQARLLSRNAVTAEREQRPGEAQMLWGQVIVKADSAYAREPLGDRGAEALWLAGHAASKLGDCSRAIPKLQGAMSAGPGAVWRQDLLFELAGCEETLGGPTAASLYSTLAGSSSDPLVVRRARLRLGHTLLLRGDWDGVVATLTGEDTLPARLDRAMALAHLGRGQQALAAVSLPLERADTAARWLGLVEALAATDGVATDSLLARLERFPNVSTVQKSAWTLAAARAAMDFDPAGADRRLQALVSRGDGSVAGEGRLIQRQLLIVRSASLPELRRAVDTSARGQVPDDGVGVTRLADLTRIAQRAISRSDATPAGSVAGDLTMFGLAEYARDSIGSPRLSAWFFARLEQQWPRSPYIAKALMARGRLEPDSAATLLDRLRALNGNPYVSAANGDLAGQIRVTQLEDSLGRFVDRMWIARPDR